MLLRILKFWLITSFVIFVAVAASYVGAQQVLRQSANDPQAIIISNIKSKVFQGEDPRKLVPMEKIDISNDLSTFVQIYDSNFNLVSGNAYIGVQNNIPKVPEGVLKKAMIVDSDGRSNVTWEPESGIRIATVGEWSTDKWFIVSGRNIWEVEKRIETLTLQYAIGFVGAVVLDLIVVALLERLLSEKRK